MTKATHRTTPRKKNEFIFYRQMSQMSRSVPECRYGSQNLPKLNV